MYSANLNFGHLGFILSFCCAQTQLESLKEESDVVKVWCAIASDVYRFVSVSIDVALPELFIRFIGSCMTLT